MTMVCATAPSQHVQPCELRLETAVVPRELDRIASVQFSRFVQLRVALGRGVRTQRADALHPCSALGEHMLEVRRVGAVDPKVGGVPGCLSVYLLDGRLQGLARWKRPVR